MRHLADRSNRLQRFAARATDEPPDTDEPRAFGALDNGGTR